MIDREKELKHCFMLRFQYFGCLKNIIFEQSELEFKPFYKF